MCLEKGRVKFEKHLIDKILLIFSVVLFVLGISLPMFTLQKFVVIKDSFSLLNGAFDLLKEGEVFLFIVIFGFSVVVPIYKFALFWKISGNKITCLEERLNRVKRLIAISKWSMADVFVIAILASTVKLGAIATIKVHIGLLFFGMSVIATMVLSQRILSDYELKPKYKIT